MDSSVEGSGGGGAPPYSTTTTTSYSEYCKSVTVIVACLVALVTLGGFLICIGRYSDSDGPLDHPKYTYNWTTLPPTNDGCFVIEGEGCGVRLNPSVLPLHYKLFLHPHIQLGTFRGRVVITLEVNENTDHFRLHTKFLNISRTELVEVVAEEGDETIPVTGSEYKENELWVVRTPRFPSFTKGKYKLSLNFEGSLTRGIVGFYRSSYFDKTDNQTKFVVSSKFQSTYARRAFPCFDEPGFKSRFSVTLVKPSHLLALSNMPLQRERVDIPTKGFTTVEFEESVPMVTYLVAVAIGDFGYLEETRTEGGVPVRIYATSNQINQTRYAASITHRILDFYEGYFNISYPLPKLDVVGIPDFVSGAMEHWGLVSFREANLLAGEASSASSKQRIAAVLAHELAHMWFGNLMTLKWWDDLWLNEARRVEEGWNIYSSFHREEDHHPTSDE